jgi:hypothetical protein
MREKETDAVITDFQEKLNKEFEKKQKEIKKQKADPKEKAFWDHLQQ